MAANPKPLRRLIKQIIRTHCKHTNRSQKEIMRMSREIEDFSLGRGHYILKGRTPIQVDFFICAIWFEHCRARIIKRTELPGAVGVSTIFLGIDHGFGSLFGDGRPPILFETMIFGGDHNGYQDRYATYEEALEGHQKAIEFAFTVPWIQDPALHI